MVDTTSQEATQDEISTLGYFCYQLELKLLSCAQNNEIPGCTKCYFGVVTCKIPGCTMCYLEVVMDSKHSQFHCVKFLFVQHMRVKYSYYSIFVLFLGIHIKGTQKYLISQCEMENQQEPLLDKDTTNSTDLELVALDNLPSSQPSASTSTAQPSRLQTYSSKQRRLQVTRHTKGTVENTALLNSTPFAEQCYHIIQYLHSPEIDKYYPDYINDKHARQNFKRKAERYKWDEIRQKLFYPKDDQFKNSK